MTTVIAIEALQACHGLHHQPAPPHPSCDTPARICPIHHVPKRLRRHGHGDRLVARCYRCEREAAKRCRKRHLRRQTAGLLRSDARYVAGILTAMRRSWGSLDSLLEGMPIQQRLPMMGKLAIAIEELNERARAAHAVDQAALKQGAKNWAMIATANQLLLELRPAELRPILERLILRARDRRWMNWTGDGDGV